MRMRHRLYILAALLVLAGGCGDGRQQRDSLWVDPAIVAWEKEHPDQKVVRYWYARDISGRVISLEIISEPRPPSPAIPQ